MANTKFSTSSIKQGLVKSKSMLVGNTGDISDFESIATTTVVSNVSSVTFSSIPATYTHLQIRAIARGTQADISDQIGIQFNGDTSANYVIHQFGGNGSIVFSGGNASQTRLVPAYIAGSSTAANIFGVGVINILDYANTNKYTTVRGLSGWDSNGAGYTILRSGLWLNTNAITSIVFTPDSGSFVQYSSFALYGIKTA